MPPRLPTRLWRSARLALLAGVVVVSGGSAAWLASAAAKKDQPKAAPAPAGENAKADKLRRVGESGVHVPADVIARMGLKTAPASAPTRARKLPPFPGTLAVDTNRTAPVNARFPGEVTELGTTTDPLPSAFPGAASARGEPRPFRVNDRVKKGDLLAVVWSSALGDKKSELVTALAQLKADEINLKRLEEALATGATSEASVRAARLAVAADRSAAAKAEWALRTWKLSDDEIAAIKAIADKIDDPASTRTFPADWARVEVRSPRDGTLIEKNLTAVGTQVDTSAVLFKVADLSKLAVWAHVYEEDLPLLQAATNPSTGVVPWVVSLPSRPGTAFAGHLESIGAVIDPAQHTALVTGTVDNPNGDLRSGMFVTVAVELPPAAGEVELPAEAVIEDGKETAVFVRAGPDATEFTRRAVKVVRRFRDVVYVTADPNGVKPGELVVTSGSLLLNDAVADLPQPRP